MRRAGLSPSKATLNALIALLDKTKPDFATYVFEDAVEDALQRFDPQTGIEIDLHGFR
jgi:hypothetical protein